ncbi:hypothetical protein SAMN05444411_103220 [Lutibacter oricola]|uniref:Glycosyltransferase n=1 Tax=Lutibacter oricola TaxID=762486 RepID=A0A1H2ZDV5_9FLAO|nr:TIGR04282 family arsenosugar biosynthesis glycosyltransferase [Lutibacter oricola]SDX15556.1 hypothetical protein SAMN05444411_103220 [Lutibacter oricola]
MKNNLLLVFTRNPELGKVKTRLAKTIGDKAALKTYKILLAHTAKIIENIDCDKAIYYSVKIRNNDGWSEAYQKYQQEGEDLGIRMYNAFKKGFESGYKKVVIVGSDLFDLEEKHINKAFEKLTDNDVVIGPAEDGGYYLLGLKKENKAIFQHKNWGTSTVLNDTLQDLKEHLISFLDVLNDIDTYEDLEKNTKLKQLIND